MSELTYEERFLLRVAHEGECLVWTGDWSIPSPHKMPNGLPYGRFSFCKDEPEADSRGRIMAHRYAYLRWVGPIPSGYQIDHLCGNTMCVRIDHLEAVTPEENTLRGRMKKGCPYCPKGKVLYHDEATGEPFHVYTIGSTAYRLPCWGEPKEVSVEPTGPEGRLMWSRLHTTTYETLPA